MFTDLAWRAVHIQVVFGYDTSNFLMALSTCTYPCMTGENRQWPRFSTCGCREGAQGSLEKDLLEDITGKLHTGWSDQLGHLVLPIVLGIKKHELLTKVAKCSIHFSVSNQGLSVHEFLTVCNEVSNLLNEPPIGVKPSEDSIINVLTPNSLLQGRAIWDKHFLLVSPCPVSGGGLLETMDRTECANSVSTAQMAHCKMQLAPWRCSNQADKNTLRGDLSLGTCERGVSRRRWKSAKSGYSVQKLSNWGESSWVPRCKRHCSLESSATSSLLVLAEWSL